MLISECESPWFCGVLEFTFLKQNHRSQACWAVMCLIQRNLGIVLPAPVLMWFSPSSPLCAENK